MTTRRRRALAAAIVATVVAGLSFVSRPAQAATPTPDQQWAAIQSLLANIKGRWTDQSYVNSIVNGMPSTALLGNGDIGVTSSGSTGVKTFLVSKGDFWRGNPGPAIAPVGGVTLAAASGGGGSANLALGATATATSSHPSFPPGRAVSGQWGPGYEGWVSAIGKPQTITVDLGTSKTFTRYVVRHDSAARPAETANNTKSFQVQTSTDNQSWSTWDTIANNAAAVTDRTLASRTARWIRLVITEPTQGTTPDSQQNPRARIGQLELYGAGGGPGGPGGTFLEEQNILRGEVDTTMTIGGQPVVMKTWVAANDNLLVTQIRSTGTAPVRLEARTWSGATNPMSGFTQTAGVSGTTAWAARTTPSGSRYVSRAALATRVIGTSPVGAPTASGNTARFQFDLQPGQTLRLMTAVAGGGANPPDPVPTARSLADAQTGTALDGLFNAHADWWKQYWLRSYVDLNDDVLERFYYAAQYFLGSASRNGKTAPGLYGLWITKDDPYFSGDYHMNYNFVSSFYGAYSSNRSDFALPLMDAIIGYLPEARRLSTQDLQRVKPDHVTPRFGSGGIPGGVLFPVGIGPLATATPDTNYWQQVGNALFNVVEFIAYWDYTRDRTYLQTKAYPFMKEVATFFSRWMEYDAATGRYTTWGGPHEGTWARNPSLDVGMLRYLLTSLLAASSELGLDAGTRPLWQRMLSGLPPIATTTYNGKTVYALGDPGTISDGRAIRPGDNTVNLEFIHPGEGLGIESPQADRQRAIDTLDAMGSWGQDNSFPKVFTQAARVGYPAQSLVDKLKAQITAKTDANLRIRDEWHGLEKSGATEAVNNLLLQSDDGVIRVFPVWPAGRDASFVRLREKDAFLVSSQLTAGRVGYVDLTSEAGRQVRLRNPWPGRPVVVTRVGGGAVTPTVSGDVVSFPTQAGATYTVTSP